MELDGNGVAIFNDLFALRRGQVCGIKLQNSLHLFCMFDPREFFVITASNTTRLSSCHSYPVGHQTQHNWTLSQLIKHHQNNVPHEEIDSLAGYALLKAGKPLGLHSMRDRRRLTGEHECH